MKPDLAFLETLARQAGEILRAGQISGYQISYKSLIDIVTEMDHRSEEYLVGEILRNFPDHRIIAEESGDRLGGNCDCMWYIDPLDGTVNYAHGLPLYCVSIAYAENNEVQLGVIYQPVLDECFSAERGRGAWLNGKTIRISAPPDLDHSLLATGFPYDIRTSPKNNLDHYVRLSRLSQGVRRLGSAALDCCYVACGRLDGYWEVSVKSYDVAAGGLIAQEAGALATALDGNPDYLTYQTSILIAPAQIHAQLVKLLNNPVERDSPQSH